MQLVVGYDRSFTELFRRTFGDLTANHSEWAITKPEQDYVAEKLTDTTLFGFTPSMGSPWVFDDVEYLARVSSHGIDRTLFSHAELAANQILVMQGIVARGGVWRFRRDVSSGMTLERSTALASTLFNNAARWERLSDNERLVLRLMAQHVSPWINLLALV